MSETRNVRIEYYAVLREQRGTVSEIRETRAKTARELYEELKAEHRFTLPVERLAVAINEEFAAWESHLQPGDSIVFIPPVAGG